MGNKRRKAHSLSLLAPSFCFALFLHCFSHSTLSLSLSHQYLIMYHYLHDACLCLVSVSVVVSMFENPLFNVCSLGLYSHSAPLIPPSSTSNKNNGKHVMQHMTHTHTTLMRKNTHLIPSTEPLYLYHLTCPLTQTCQPTTLTYLSYTHASTYNDIMEYRWLP